jgi:hypothetical protein
MDSKKIAETSEVKSLRKAALVAGLAILLMALTVPVVEFYIFPKLVDYKNPLQTINNIVNHRIYFLLPSLFILSLLFVTSFLPGRFIFSFNQ